MDLPFEDFLDHHKDHHKDHGKDHRKNHSKGHGKDYDHHEDCGENYDEEGYSEKPFVCEKVNRKPINIRQVLLKSGKYRRECEHTGQRVPKRDNIPSSIFDLKKMETISLDPECRRCIAKLDEYDIVSYVWGYCRHVIGFNEPLPVDSLCEVLGKLVGVVDRQRYVWIDALCIDQDSLEEKSKNIPIMGSLYKNARRCFAFLDIDFGETANNIDHLTTVMNMYIMYGAGYSSEENASPFGNIDGLVGDISMLISSISKIFDSRWFSRVWTVQENLLSKNLDFVGHDLIFSKARLVTFIDCVLKVSNEDQECNQDPFETLETIGYLTECREKIHMEGEMGALSVLRILSERDATKLQDRVYGILALFPNLNIPVRYDLSVEEIYKTFQIELLKSGDHSVLLIDGAYYRDLSWACSLNKGQYVFIGYMAGALGYLLDEDPWAAKTHVRKKARDAKIKIMRDSIRIDGFVRKIEDIARIKEISDIEVEPSSNFSIATLTTTMGEERICAMSNKSKAWMDGERKYIGSLDDGEDILMFLTTTVESCYCVYIQSSQDSKEHFWVIYDDGSKLGVGVTYGNADGRRGNLVLRNGLSHLTHDIPRYHGLSHDIRRYFPSDKTEYMRQYNKKNK